MKRPKKGEIIPPLWSIEVHFMHEGKEKKWLIENQSGEEVMNFRLAILQSGFNFQVTAIHSEIIFPQDLVRIWLDLQKGWQE